MTSILQAGVAKSGNYWLWKIIDAILEEGGIQRQRFITKHPIYQELKNRADLTHENQSETDVIDFEKDGAYFRVSSIYKEKIKSIDEYLESCSHVWTHSKLNNIGLDTLPRFERVIYIVRDPRDVAISMANFSFTPYMKKYMPHKEKDFESYISNRLEWQTRTWVFHVCSWLKAANRENVLIIFYENLKSETKSEIKKLSNFLDITLSEQAVDRIAMKVSAKTMKQKNPNHVRDAKNGGWESTLTIKQKKLVAELAAPLLKAMNYDIDPIATEGGRKFFNYDSYGSDGIEKLSHPAGYSAYDKIRAAKALIFGKRTLKNKIEVMMRHLYS